MKLTRIKQQEITSPLKNTVAILNSHQSKRPCRANVWVDRTVNLVSELAKQEKTLLTSIGLNTWELLVYLTASHNLSQLIIIPAIDDAKARGIAEDTIREFDLHEKSVEFACLCPPSSREWMTRKKLYQLRDEIIFALAETIIPVSVNPEGRLASLLKNVRSTSRIENSYSVPYQPAKDKPRYALDKSRLLPATIRALENHLIHWTRSSHTPYPDETSASYYDDIISSYSYPRSAFCSLKRISSQERIRASSRFIRGGFEVVSFSDSGLAESLSLMRWRRRYVYYNFEPYGVAIPKKYAGQAGLKPVIYGKKSDYDSLKEADRPYFQTGKSNAADWTPESEWRHVGDIDLASLPDDGLRFVVYKSAEIEKLKSATEREVLSLFP